MAFTLAGASLADPVVHMVSRLDASQFGGMTNEATVGLASIRAQNVARASAESVLASASTCKISGGRDDGGGGGGGGGGGSGSGLLKDALPGGISAPVTEFAAGGVLQRIAVLPAYLEVAKDAPVPQQNPHYESVRMSNACMISIAFGVPMAYLAPHLSHAQIQETAEKTLDAKCRTIAKHFKSVMELTWDETNGKALRAAYNKCLNQTDVCFAAEERLQEIAASCLGHARHTRRERHVKEIARGVYRSEKPEHLRPLRDVKLHNTKLLKQTLGLSKTPKHDAYLDGLREIRGQSRSSGLLKRCFVRPDDRGIDLKHGMNKTGRPVELTRDPLDARDNKEEGKDEAPVCSPELKTGSDTDVEVEGLPYAEGRKRVRCDDEEEETPESDSRSGSGSDMESGEEKDDDDGLESRPKGISGEEIIEYFGLTSDDIEAMLSHLTDEAYTMVTSLVALQSTRVNIKLTRTQDLHMQKEMYDEGKLDWSTVRWAISQLTGVKLSEVPEEDPIVKQKKLEFEIKQKEMELAMETKEREMQLDLAKMKAGLIPDCRQQIGGSSGQKAAPVKPKQSSSGDKITKPRTGSLDKRQLKKPSKEEDAPKKKQKA